MPRLKNITWRDTAGGVVQKISSDPGIYLKNAVPFSMNMLFEEHLGEATSRTGTAILNAQQSAGNTCEGLFQHIDSTLANSKLFAAFNGTLHDVIDGTANQASLTAGNKFYFTTFLNTTLALNGTDTYAYDSINGWHTSGQALRPNQMPAGAKYPIEFLDRMYAVVTDRIYYSTTPIGGAISWTNIGSGSLQAEQEDGGGTIQGVSKVPGYMMIFKERSLKRWNTQSTFPEDLVRVGTQSQASIVTAKGRNFFFYGPNGFYETNGGYPTLISRPVQRIIDAIPESAYKNIYGWSDDEHCWWFLGDLTIDFDRGYTEAYSNVGLRYTIRSQQWAPLQWGNNLSFLHQYVTSGTPTAVIAGDNDGNVLKLNTGTTDYGGLAINYILQSPEFDFGNRSKLKTISDSIIVHHDRATGAVLEARLDYGEWKQIGSLDRDIVAEVNLSEVLYCNVAEFRITDMISNEQIKIRGLDLPNVFITDQTSLEV